VDSAYGSKLGPGERDIIRIGVAFPEIFVVIDDKDAFQIASRFGLKPTVLQDMIVLLSHQYHLPQSTAIEIVSRTASRYPASYLVHTLALLGGGAT
jgi:hypothetical protein